MKKHIYFSQTTKTLLLGRFCAETKETIISPLNSVPSAFSNHELLIFCYKMKKRVSSRTNCEKKDPLQTQFASRHVGRKEGGYLGTQTNEGTKR